MKISDLFTRVDSLTVSETKKMMEEKGHDGLTLIDVREPAEYEAGHIPGALFSPLSHLADNLDKLDLSGTVVTYCKRGPRSRSAAALLKRQGSDDVYYMDGGIDAWNGLVASGSYETGLFLLEGIENVEDLVTLAWALEDGTGTFYAQMRELSEDEEARQVFESLMKAEQNHKSKLLEAYRHITGKEINDEKIRTQTIRGHMEGGVSVDELVGILKKERAAVREILEVSMQVESNSLDLYMKMLTKVQDVSARKALNVLIEEEKAHLIKLGALLESKINI
ncbi:MAG: rhodanese-like domain-containing protein [Nitrospirota bacterium]